MSAHTPGPWVVEHCYLGSSTVAQMRSPDRLVCINAAGGADAEPPGFKATYANARLIAAAPELLGALRKAQTGFIELHAQGIGCPDCPETDGEDTPLEKWCPAVAAGEAAIAKAEGR